MFENLCNTFFDFNKVCGNAKKILASSALAFCTFISTFNVYADSLNQVRVVIDGKWYFYTTMNMKISDFFKAQNIVINEKDIVDTNINSIIDKDMTIYIDKAETVKFLVDNKKEVPFVTNSKSIGTALKEFSKETNIKVYLDEGQSSSYPIFNDMVIRVSSFKEEIKTIKEDIPYSSKTIENSNLSEGVVKVKTKGVNGVREKVIKETYRDERLEDSQIIKENITKQPITEVIEKGTKKNTVKTDKGIFTFNKKMNMRSTAYTAGPESTGKRPGDKGYGITASGMKARRGVVAVDTRVIPFGTKLYIEGYGYAVAGDTGSAIKGNKIDVFLDRESDARQYGVRHVDVYVLDEKIS